MTRLALPAWAALVALALSGCSEAGLAAATGLGPSKPGVSSSGPLLSDPAFLKEGGRVCSRDLAYLAVYCDRAAKAGMEDPTRLANTRRLAQKALAEYPQTTWFQFERSGRSYRLSPLGPTDEKPIREAKADIAIVGGELSALCTAVEAADAGYDVAVVYAGPLGGVASDEGANLRYFDVMRQTSHPAGQKKIWSYLKVPGYCALPANLSRKLERFFQERYFQKVQLIKTRSYDDLSAVVRSGRVVEAVTAEGTAVRAERFIDMDPEARLAEKCGLPRDTDTQHLSYGLVFDLKGIRPQDWNPLGDRARVTPEAIAKLAGADLGAVSRDRASLASLKTLRKHNAKGRNLVGASYRLGYQALAQGFDFYMRCLGSRDPQNKKLAWLNSRRCVSGFNIATFYKDAATFNSVSYKFRQSILQHSHSLTRDPLFEPIRSVEMPALQAYFRWVSGNPKLTVRMPEQLYVRRASAFFPTRQPYQKAEFNKTPTAPFHTFYPMDLRDLHPRDPYSWPIIERYVKLAKHSHLWDCRPSAAMTDLANLYLVNRSAVTPVFYGGQRIEGNQINMGAALVASFGKPKPDRPR